LYLSLLHLVSAELPYVLPYCRVPWFCWTQACC
jgi:hypothetical protein